MCGHRSVILFVFILLHTRAYRRLSSQRIQRWSVRSLSVSGEWNRKYIPRIWKAGRLTHFIPAVFVDRNALRQTTRLKAVYSKMHTLGRCWSECNPNLLPGRSPCWLQVNGKLFEGVRKSVATRMCRFQSGWRLVSQGLLIPVYRRPVLM
ncbi:hypothetical protein BKA70DRAFT_852072 [Coprinopsis sp. MPI-PUGE-AT-0042]|nr:hypothetical protein BKA70DRAFT_852072 [Coprinopsis sp. MPI-PUGE-AT-0042]